MLGKGLQLKTTILLVFFLWLVKSLKNRVWYAGLHKRKSYGISGHIFDLISSFLSNRWLQAVPDGMSSQEYPVNAGVSQGSIFDPTLFLLYLTDLPDNVIFHIAICVDDITLYSKCD